MKLVGKNITLENVKESKYWDLIAILVWNHYSEERYQDNSCIEIKEQWCGISNIGSLHSNLWNNPDFKEDGFIRTLNYIEIKFKRSDYITYININTDGNIHCFGFYTDKKNEKTPNYHNAQRNLDITNWMLDNGFIEIIE